MRTFRGSAGSRFRLTSTAGLLLAALAALVAARPGPRPEPVPSPRSPAGQTPDEVSALDQKLGVTETFRPTNALTSISRFGLTPDGARLVANHVAISGNDFRSSVSVVDLADPQRPLVEVLDIAAGIPADIAVSPDGTRAYNVLSSVSGTTDTSPFGGKNRVEFIDLTKSPIEIEKTVAFDDDRATTRIAVSPDGSRLYVTDRGQSRVIVLDAVSGDELAAVRTTDLAVSQAYAPVGIAITPDGAKVLAVNRGQVTTPSVAIIDTASNTLDQVVPVSLVQSNSGSIVAVGPAPSQDQQTAGQGMGKVFRAYVTVDAGAVDEPCMSVLEIDVENETYQEIAVVPGVAPRSFGMLVSPDGQKVFISSGFPPGEVTIFNAHTPALEQRISLVGSSASLVFDPTRDPLTDPRLYVRTSGTTLATIENIRGDFLSPDGDSKKTEALVDHAPPEGDCPDPSAPGEPDPGIDPPLDFTRDGDLIRIFNAFRPDQIFREIQFLNHHPVTGAPTEIRLINPNASEAVPAPDQGTLSRVTSWLMRPLTQLTEFQQGTFLIDSYDSQFRPRSASVTTDFLGMEGLVSTMQTMDENEDGINEGLSLDLPLLPATDVDFELFANGGEHAEYARVAPPFPLSMVIPEFYPLGDTTGDGIPDSIALDFDGDGEADPDLPLMPFLAGTAHPEVELKLYFAQFGNGVVGNFTVASQITLFNLDGANEASVKVLLRDDDGDPLALELNGELVQGEKEAVIPPAGLIVLSTNGEGGLVSGSVTVCSDRAVAGVVTFEGTAGVAGVGNGNVTRGFVAPMERSQATGINTGIAVMNLEAEEVALLLQLCDRDGQILARAELSGEQALRSMGHLDFFVDEMEWNEADGIEELDFSDFKGLLKVTASGKVAATVIQTRPGEFATMPVARDLRQLVATSGLTPQLPVRVDLDQKLYFAQFGKGSSGGVNVASQIHLINPNAAEARVRVLLRGDDGTDLPVSLTNVDGEEVNLEEEIIIPAGGVRVLRTEQEGELIAGSVIVCSNQVLSGVILFGGSAGVAGVGTSPKILRRFTATMEARTEDSISTGVAVMNLEEFEVELDLALCDPEGSLLATAEMSLAPLGHRAVFLQEINWETEKGAELDFSDFRGLLKVSAGGKTAATVVQTRLGVFATQPVVPDLNQTQAALPALSRVLHRPDTAPSWPE